MKRAFNMKEKAFFITSKGLLLKETKTIFLEGKSPTLILNINNVFESKLQYDFEVGLKPLWGIKSSICFTHFEDLRLLC